jgi:iron(III) transport system permease protein
VIKELPATALLRPLGRDTLAILTWEATKDARFDVAALPALLIVAVGLVPVVSLVRLRDRAGPGAGPGRRARSRPAGSPRGSRPRR